MAEKLDAAGVINMEQLLERAATPQGRAELAQETGVPETTVLEWANELDLARVKGIGPANAALLRAAGVNTVPELARRNAANLALKLADVNSAAEIVETLPTTEMITGWIAQANELPRVITY